MSYMRCGGGNKQKTFTILSRATIESGYLRIYTTIQDTKDIKEITFHIYADTGHNYRFKIYLNGTLYAEPSSLDTDVTVTGITDNSVIRIDSPLASAQCSTRIKSYR